LQLGHWNRTHGLNITKTAKKRQEDIQKDLTNRTLVVVVKEEHPFIMIRKFDLEGKPIPEGCE